MVGLGFSQDTRRLFPQVGAEISDQIGKMLPVEGPDRFALEGVQEPQFQAEPGFLAILNLRVIGETFLRRLMYLARHGCPAIGAGHVEGGKSLFCLIFNIHPVVSAAVFALVMHVITVDHPITGHLVAAAQAAETGFALIRRHHAQTAASGAFHLNPGGKGAVGAVGKIMFIDNSFHRLLCIGCR